MTAFAFRHLTLTVLVTLFAFAPLSASFGQAAQEQPAQEQPAGYSGLADLLENDVTRSELIDELRRLAGERVETTPTPAPESVSFARRLAGMTHYAAERVVAEIAGIYHQVAAFDRSAVSAQAASEFGSALLELIVVIVIVAAAIWLLRSIAARLYARSSAWVERGDGKRLWLRRGGAALSCGLVDFAIVLAGWLIGYAAALFVLGEGGRMDTRQSLFLNAFLVVETFRVVIRLLFANRYDGLRLLPVKAEDAAYWNAWLSRLGGFVGYGILVAAPIAATYLGAAAGHLLSGAVYALALAAAIAIIRQNRQAVRTRLASMAERSNVGFIRLALGTLARTWHLLAIAYLTAFIVLMVVRPGAALGFMLAATVQSIGALLLGSLVSTLIDRGIAMGIRLQSRTRQQFPMLEERLNAFVPGTLKFVRILITVVVLAIIIDAWSVFDVFAWAGSESGMRVLGTFATITLIIAGAVGVWLLISSWIEHRLNLGLDGNSVGASAREKTLLSLFRNAFTIALVVVVTMITLSELGLDIGPLLAGAGVLGLAIGFGAQKLVQDVITGVFIQLENAMNTGDVVSAGGITGVVERLTVRSVGIRDLSGTYHLIPFSSVDTVSNFMRGFGFHVGEYRVAYRENVDDVIEILKLAFEDLRKDPDQEPFIIDELEVHGVTEFADSSVTVRVRVKTLPGYQWPVGRAYNGLVKKRLDAADIKVPYPHLTLNVGEAGQVIETPSGKSGSRSTGKPRPARKRVSGPRKAPAQDIPSQDEVDR
ncbi:mechanosensitive ion channel domain-containing protein [Mesorhizobium sp. CAU 1732]|uniref:mechanosensitive ion channel domain-containing protein n=1 Tax=Mesorhizobium sp. CAU 1732 TaxID=3140358 RepID=UPI00325FEA11